MQHLINVQESICKGFAIQGNKDSRFVWSDTVVAKVETVKEIDGKYLDKNSIDFNVVNFEIQSAYWNEQSLKDFAGI